MPDWNEIVNHNAANVLNAAYRVLGNLDDAEDVSQDVFAEAFCKWQSAPEQNWAGLLRQLSVFRAIDSLRKRKPTQILPPDVNGRANDPVDSAIGNEILQRLRVAVSRLPPREAQVFCLMYFEQQSHHEISQTLEISKAAVATALSKARSNLEVAFREISTGESK